LIGAESLVASLAYEGVELCFANPGTAEMHFLAALENPRFRRVRNGQSMGCPSVKLDNAADFYTSMVNSTEEPGPVLF
jgi:hypothetical protein